MAEARIKRIYNRKPSPPDVRDFEFRRAFFRRALPPAVDLRARCSPVVDQGELGSCTGNAIASGLREFMLLKSGAALVPLSRLFVYYEERLAEGTTDEDSGACIRDGLKCLLNLGVCREALDPYSVADFRNPPSDQALADAPNFRIKRFQRVRNLSDVKSVLAGGDVLVAGMSVFDQMESDEAAAAGIVRIPPQGSQPLGGHAVTVVGYVDTPKWQPGYWKGGGYLWIRNSWGTDWGAAGYFRVAYDYVNLNLMDEFWSAS